MSRCDGVRVFVGVRIAPEITAELARIAGSPNRSAVRFVAPDDVHLTLVPPWNEECIPDAIGKLRSVACGFGAFSLAFRHFGYGPQPRRPRLLWAECAADDELARLRAALLAAFGQADARPFRPHVTIARIRRDGRSTARDHPIDQDLSLAQSVEAIELLQSPPPGASGYQVLASVPLGKIAPAPAAG